jgi:uncharacterized membrane protein
MSPGKLIILAFFMLLAGAVLPFLILIGVLDSTFPLNFFIYIVSVGGLFLGVLGIAQYVGKERSRGGDDWKDN